MDANLLPDKTEKQNAFKSKVVGVNVYHRKPDTYNNKMPWYMACANTDCNKKVDDTAMQCANCNAEFVKPIPR